MIFIFFIIIVMALEVELFRMWIAEINDTKSSADLENLLNEATQGNRSLKELRKAKLAYISDPANNNAWDTYRVIHRNRVLFDTITLRIHNFPINRP